VGGGIAGRKKGGGGGGVRGQPTKKETGSEIPRCDRLFEVRKKEGEQSVPTKRRFPQWSPQGEGNTALSTVATTKSEIREIREKRMSGVISGDAKRVQREEALIKKYL